MCENVFMLRFIEKIINIFISEKNGIYAFGTQYNWYHLENVTLSTANLWVLQTKDINRVEP